MSLPVESFTEIYFLGKSYVAIRLSTTTHIFTHWGVVRNIIATGSRKKLTLFQERF